MLELHNISAYQQQTRVFERLFLRIGAQEKVAILGPNESGKSTLLKLLNRELYPLQQPDSWLKLFGSETVNLCKRFNLKHSIEVMTEVPGMHHAAPASIQ